MLIVEAAQKAFHIKNVNENVNKHEQDTLIWNRDHASYINDYGTAQDDRI